MHKNMYVKRMGKVMLIKCLRQIKLLTHVLNSPLPWFLVEEKKISAAQARYPFAIVIMKTKSRPHRGKEFECLNHVSPGEH